MKFLLAFFKKDATAVSLSTAELIKAKKVAKRQKKYQLTDWSF